jgi:hypothetical protein
MICAEGKGKKNPLKINQPEFTLSKEKYSRQE